MSKKETYAKLPYSLYASEAWQKYPYDPVKAYIDLCFNAEKQDTVYNCDFGSVELKKGQYATTYSALAKRWRCTISKVRHFLNLLEISGLIERGKTRPTGAAQPTAQITVLTIKALRGSAAQQSAHMNNNILSNDNNSESDARSSGFVIPSLQEIQQYLDEKGEHRFTAEEFYDYYDTRGWFLAKGVKMKSWKGAVRTWIGKRNNGEFIKINRNDYISRSALKAQEQARRDEEFRRHIIQQLTSPDEPDDELPFE